MDSGRPKMRVHSDVLRWLMDQQKPREDLADTLKRILTPIMARTK